MDHNPFQCKACQTHLHQVTFARVLELSHGYKCSFRVVNTSHRNVRYVTKHLLQLICCNRSFKIVHFLKTFKCSFVEWSQIHFNVTHITTHLHQVTFARVLGLSHGYKCLFCIIDNSIFTQPFTKYKTILSIDTRW